MPNSVDRVFESEELKFLVLWSISFLECEYSLSLFYSVPATARCKRKKSPAPFTIVVMRGFT
jgi:hypothetical protein